MRSVTATLFIMSVTAISAAAQSVSPVGQTGFHASLGMGYGSVGLTCSGCGTSRNGSVAGMLRLGGAIRQNLVLGGQLTEWAKTTNNGTASGGLLSFVTQWYPQVSHGFFLEGGIGVAAMDATADVPGYGSTEARTTSLGLQGGLGYDISVTRRVAVTPYAELLYAADADLRVNGSSTGYAVGANMLHIGLAASWR